jgi:hypothetical protein
MHAPLCNCSSCSKADVRHIDNVQGSGPYNYRVLTADSLSHVITGEYCFFMFNVIIVIQASVLYVSMFSMIVVMQSNDC